MNQSGLLHIQSVSGRRLTRHTRLTILNNLCYEDGNLHQSESVDHPRDFPSFAEPAKAHWSPSVIIPDRGDSCFASIINVIDGFVVFPILRAQGNVISKLTRRVLWSSTLPVVSGILAKAILAIFWSDRIDMIVKRSFER